MDGCWISFDCRIKVMVQAKLANVLAKSYLNKAGSVDLTLFLNATTKA